MRSKLATSTKLRDLIITSSQAVLMRNTSIITNTESLHHPHLRIRRVMTKRKVMNPSRRHKSTRSKKVKMNQKMEIEM